LFEFGVFVPKFFFFLIALRGFFFILFCFFCFVLLMTFLRLGFFLFSLRSFFRVFFSGQCSGGWGVLENFDQHLAVWCNFFFFLGFVDVDLIKGAVTVMCHGRRVIFTNSFPSLQGELVGIGKESCSGPFIHFVPAVNDA